MSCSEDDSAKLTPQQQATMAASIKNYKSNRALIKGKLTRFKLSVDNAEDEVSIEELRLRLSKFKSLYDDFDDIQTKIDLLDGDTESERERADFEDKYFATINKCQRKIKDFENTLLAASGSSVGLPAPSQTHFEANQRAQLPKLEVPTFSGDYQEWLPYKELFIALVHSNETISTIQKFHYLRLSLKCDASKLVDSLPVTSENYSVAWQLLQERYQNQKIIVQNLIRSLFEYVKVTKESAPQLRNLLDHFQRQVRTLEGIGQPVQHWDAFLIHLFISKMDPATLRAWEFESSPTEVPKFSDICKFLEIRCQSLDALEQEREGRNKLHKVETVKDTAKKLNIGKYGDHPKSYFASSSQKCSYCKEEHFIQRCPTFRNLDYKDKKRFVWDNKLCTNCLHRGHVSAKCKGSTCRTCNKKHNTLLHFQDGCIIAKSEDNPTDASGAAVPHTTVQSLAGIACGPTQVMLSTANVLVQASDGTYHTCRALLDSGSTHSFISQDLCQQLRLKCYDSSVAVSSINSHSSQVLCSTHVKFKDAYRKGFKGEMQCLVLPTIATDVPSLPIDISSMHFPSGIQIADPKFDIPARVDMLIGADLFWELLLGQVIYLGSRPNDGLSLRETKFGWIITGDVPVTSHSNESAKCHFISTEMLSQQMERFWYQEEFPTRILSEDENRCEELFVSTVKRQPDGRYSVQMPMKDPTSVLGASRQQALKRFFAMETRLHRNPKLLSEYAKFMTEYINLGHMERITSGFDDDGNHVYYLPHHPVIKESSTTTKLRVVFDGSAKSSSGKSLNDLLMVGPLIQQDLYSLILRLRCHRYAVTADIEKMYRNVLVDETQRDLQRIFWRESKDRPIQIFRLNTVTYGLSPSSFLAIRVLHRLAEDEGHRFPLAAQALKHDFYVDDYIGGGSSVEEVMELRQQLTDILRCGGFHITKWCANDERILSTIPESERSTCTLLDFENNQFMKTLGLHWNPKVDSLQYVVANQITAFTKRKILSEISKLFDPLGLLGPVITLAKLIIQQLWKLQTGWDDPVPEDILHVWNRIHVNLPEVMMIRIPRYVLCDQKSPTVDLHIFCDASEAAYGACAYLRVSSDGVYQTRLLTAKSRVSPLKKVSLPRLELSAALLASELYVKILSAITFVPGRTYLWTDSTIVLAWLARPPEKWSTYVANRVTKIQNSTQSHEWHHVRSVENPADVISRGLFPEELQSNDLWWFGPTFLNHVEDDWPICTDALPEHVPETKKHAETCLTVFSQEDLLLKYSSLRKLLRVVAWCLRFIHNVSPASSPIKGPISLAEVDKAKICILRLLQRQVFPKEMHQLENGRAVDKQSRISSLSPFIDENGLIRVGGRIQHADLSYNQRHPIILPKNHHLTFLIVRDEHYRNLHLGPQSLLYALRQKYWPMNGLRTVKSALKECLVCFRFKPKPAQQIMGSLPEVRIVPSRPFTHTGVDYAGPFNIKTGLVRSRTVSKAYIALFVCMATKALHLELVSSLSTEAFISALKRLISRRGRAEHIYSDNGSNFVGACRELQELYDLVTSAPVREEIITYTSDLGITWHFSPPKGPHFGALWEINVKCVKAHLLKAIRYSVLTFEECYTLLAQIEAILNSRPLTPLSENPSDLLPLTPAHFLVGGPVTAYPEPTLEYAHDSRLSRWQTIEKRKQQFWCRWSKEYLCSLQHRRKWTETAPNVEIGDLVLLGTDGIPPLVWPAARVTALHPGPDGRVRVVTVRTAKGEYKRPIVKIYPLPKDVNFTNSPAPRHV